MNAGHSAPLARLRSVLLFGAVLMAVAWPGPLSVAAPAEPVVRAQLTPRRFAVLSAELGAKIVLVHAIEGAAFRAGDVLVTFDDALQRAQSARARAGLVAAEKTYAANQRLQHLNAVGQIELELSAAEVEKARAEVAYADAMLAKCRIIAPFSGRVAEQRVREQEFVQPGQPLLEIIDDALPELDFIAPSKWLGWLAIGHPLAICVDETGRSYPAVVERLGAKVDPVSQSVKVVAGLSGEFPELIAGMSGTIAVAPEKQP